MAYMPVKASVGRSNYGMCGRRAWFPEAGESTPANHPSGGQWMGIGRQNRRLCPELSGDGGLEAQPAHGPRPWLLSLVECLPEAPQNIPCGYADFSVRVRAQDSVTCP